MTSSASAGGGERSAITYVFWLTVSLGLMSFPFLAVQFVPSTDLPQHLSQARLLEEALGLVPRSVDFSELEFNALAPNTLVYWLMLPLHLAFSAPLAGKLTLLLLTACTLLSLHWLARRRSRAGSSALLASLFVFSAPTYWGFINFLSGAPLFFVFLGREISTRERPGKRDLVITALLVVALCWAHVFWAAAAGACVVVIHALLERDLRCTLTRLVAFVPAALLLGTWPAQLAASRQAFDLSMHYGTPVLARFGFGWWVDAMFGGVRGWLEPVATLVVGLYLVVLVVRAVRARGEGIDAPLLSAGGALVAFGLLGPEKYMNTIDLGTRFVPYGMMLILLGLPAVRAGARGALLAAFALAFSLTTTAAWILHERDELSGLSESLASVSKPTSVLGLSFKPDSSTIRVSPFVQTFAYFQAEHGGEINFSFAEHGSGLVTYRHGRKLTWSYGLEWYPSRVRHSDFEQFECVLVNAEPDMHASFQQQSGLLPHVRDGRFRLYCHH